MEILSFDEFLRSLKQNSEHHIPCFWELAHPVESGGVSSASDYLTQGWKLKIFYLKKPNLVDVYNSIKLENVRKKSFKNGWIIQRFITGRK